MLENNKKILFMKIFGIRITIDYSWFIIFFLISWTLATQYFPRMMPGKTILDYWMFSLVTSLMLFISVLIHELSHSVVANRIGEKVSEITLFIFGGIAQIEKEPNEPLKELKIAIAGPIASLVIFLALFVFLWIFGNSISFEIYQVLYYISMINLIIVIFNLIPAFPLDGGRLLRSFIWYFTKNLRKATLIATGVGKFISYLMIILGVFQAFNGILISGIWYILIGMFLYQAADYGNKQIIYDFALKGIKVRDLMNTSFVYIDENTTLNAIIDDYFIKYRKNVLPVLKNDVFAGIISVDSLSDIDRTKLKEIGIEKITEPVNYSFTISPDEETLNAVKKMIKNNIESLYVTEGARLVGVISREEIMNLLKIKIQLRGHNI